MLATIGSVRATLWIGWVNRALGWLRSIVKVVEMAAELQRQRRAALPSPRRVAYEAEVE